MDWVFVAAVPPVGVNDTRTAIVSLFLRALAKALLAALESLTTIVVVDALLTTVLVRALPDEALCNLPGPGTLTDTLAVVPRTDTLVTVNALLGSLGS